MALRLSDIRRKLVNAVDRVVKANERYQGAKKGKRAEARKKLTEAKQKARELERLFEKEQNRILREREKKEQKARELKEKADKAREALKKHLEEDARLRKKEREDWEREIERERKEKQIVEDREKFAGDIFDEPDIVRRKQPDPGQYPGRAGTGAFLQEEGWQVHFYQGAYPDVDFDASLTEPYNKGTVYPLSDWRGRDLVWWRAEVTLTFTKDPFDPAEDDGSHNPVTSLTREGTTPEGNSIYSVTGGTAWHAMPWQLENTVAKIIENIESKHGRTNRITVTWFSCSRLKKPEIQGRHKK